MFVEALCRFIFGVDDHGGGGDLFTLAPSAIESIQEKKFSKALSSVLFTDGKTPQQRGRNFGILGQLPSDLGRETDQIDRVLRQGIVPSNRCAVRRQYEANGNVSGDILSSLRAQVSVESFHTARKAVAIMKGLEDFDSEVVLRLISEDHLNCLFLVHNN